jgi:transcriptional regulator with XRE-family HTH domain
MHVVDRTNLRARRLAVGISMEKLARRADCSLTTVRLAERGFEGVSERLIAQISAALDELEAGEVVAS